MPMMQMPPSEEGTKSHLPRGSYRAYDLEVSGNHVSIAVPRELNSAIAGESSGSFFIYSKKSQGPGQELPLEGWDKIKVHVSTSDGEIKVSINLPDGSLKILTGKYELDLVREIFGDGKLSLNSHSVLVS